MLPFLYNVRDNSHIIDVLKSYGFLLVACYFCQASRAAGKDFLFISTKRQTASIIATEAERCGAYHVSYRWLGGMMTNWQTMVERLRRLATVERYEKEKITLKMSKKESSKVMREKRQLTLLFSGIKHMTKVPGVIYIIDQQADFTALKESKGLKLPTISLLDSNSNPDLVTIGIPANDDALSSIQYISRKISNSVVQQGGLQQGGLYDKK